MHLLQADQLQLHFSYSVFNCLTKPCSPISQDQAITLTSGKCYYKFLWLSFCNHGSGSSLSKTGFETKMNTGQPYVVGCRGRNVEIEYIIHNEGSQECIITYSQCFHHLRMSLLYSQGDPVCPVAPWCFYSGPKSTNQTEALKGPFMFLTASVGKGETGDVQLVAKVTWHSGTMSNCMAISLLLDYYL